MPDVLPISRAARAAGVSRHKLQKKIVDGELTSFEGMVNMEDLFAVFPPARFKESAQIQRMRMIKEAALHKSGPDDSPSEFIHLRATVKNLEEQLLKSREQATGYQHTIEALVVKVENIQKNCDKQQKAVLGTLISWMLDQLNETDTPSR